MTNILMSYRHYPVSMPRYFKRALKKMGHNVFSVGAFFPTLPWRPDRDYSKYWDVPDYAIPDAMREVFDFPVDLALENCPFTPDLILCGDAGFHLTPHNDKSIPQSIFFTDPHALYVRDGEADAVCESFDKHFVMQKCYAKPYLRKANGTERPVWHLPYAFDSDCHYWEGKNFEQRQYDVCVISGLMYGNSNTHPWLTRLGCLATLENEGFSIYTESGLLYEEMTHAYNDARIALCVSSENDLPARFWEGLAMRNLVMTNRVPDLLELSDLVEDVHYIAFSSVDEMLDKANYYRTHWDEAWAVASAGYARVWASNHTYLARAAMILDVSLPNKEGK